MIYAGILAAGLGERMHRQDIPKQFLLLGEKPILIHTLEQFCMNPRIEKIVVVAPQMWERYTEDLIAKHDIMGKEVFVITGGENKTISINNIVYFIKDTWGITDEDVLIAHDAIRPFVTQRIIEENINTAISYGAANTVIVPNDTMIVSSNGETVEEIPDKLLMYAEQTPQAYMVVKLLDVFKRAASSGVDLQNESELIRLYVKNGHDVRLVFGEYFNMKIINPYDLEVANALLKERGL